MAIAERWNLVSCVSAGASTTTLHHLHLLPGLRLATTMTGRGGRSRQHQRVPVSAREASGSNGAVLDMRRLATRHARVYTTDQQIQSVSRVAELLVEDEDRYRVLIIDSVMSIFRSEFQGRGELAERQQTLGRHLNHLTKNILAPVTAPTHTCALATTPFTRIAGCSWHV